MAAAGTSGDAPARVADAVSDAGFVRLVATADGDALAAAGLLARALAAREVPYQASLAAVPGAAATDADCTVAIGHDDGTVTLGGSPLSLAAADVAAAISPGSVDPVLALAGAAAAGSDPAGDLLEDADLERRPGVALPTDDVATGLALSTLVRASFSGDPEVAAEAVDALDGDDGRAIASLVALSGVEEAPPRAATAVERALHPHACDRFETLGGYADVLDALARVRPGQGIALALGAAVADGALSTWCAHGRAVHAAIATADASRYGGLYAVRLTREVVRAETDEPVAGGDDGARPADTSAQDDATVEHHDTDRSAAALGTVARLCLAYRSPEPVALAVGDGAAAAAADTDADGTSASALEAALRGAARALDGHAVARDGRGAATFRGDADEFVQAYREAAR